MTASEKAKQHGLRNLAEVASLTKTSFQTLNNYHKNKPDLFEIILIGCAEKSKKQRD